MLSTALRVNEFRFLNTVSAFAELEGFDLIVKFFPLSDDRSQVWRQRLMIVIV